MKARIVERFDHRYTRRYQWVVETRKSFFSDWVLHHVYDDKVQAYEELRELRKYAGIPSRRVIAETDI